MTEENLNRNYAGKGTTALSILATALSGVSLIGDGVNLFGNKQPESLSKEVFDISMALNKSEREADLLRSELNTEKKMIEVYNSLNDKLNTKVSEQQAWNANQAVTNTAVTSTLAVQQNNINQLMAMSQLYIPATNVTPLPMGRYNSWTAPTNPTTAG